MFAGTAKIEITPKGNVWMDGMIRSHRSTGVHDPLFARVLVLANSQEVSRNFAVISVDVCGLDEKSANLTRRLIEKKTGIPAKQTIIAATHTHSGPATIGFFNQAEEKYREEMEEKIVNCAVRAAQLITPVAVGCASGREETISHYRRLLADDGHIVMNWEPFPAERLKGPLGEIDPELGVLKIVKRDEPEQIICLLFNHAGHPNVMSGDNYLLSADYPGMATGLLEKEFGCNAIFVNGAQGTMDIDGTKDRDWEGVERTGTALAQATIQTAAQVHLSKTATVRGAATNYSLPARQISEPELNWAKKVLKETDGKIQVMADGVGDDYKAKLLVELHEKQGQSISVEQVCFAIGDCAFISFPGELFTEIGVRIKSESPFQHTCIIGLANGCIGYIPTREAISQGGYEVDTRCCGDAAEDIVVENSLVLLRKVYQTKPED